MIDPRTALAVSGVVLCGSVWRGVWRGVVCDVVRV